MCNVSTFKVLDSRRVLHVPELWKKTFIYQVLMAVEDANIFIVHHYCSLHFHGRKLITLLAEEEWMLQAVECAHIHNGYLQIFLP